MMADGTPDGRSEKSMMTRDMAGYTSDRRPRKASCVATGANNKAQTNGRTKQFHQFSFASSSDSLSWSRVLVTGSSIRDSRRIARVRVDECHGDRGKISGPPDERHR
jgi:hypothetical protein